MYEHVEVGDLVERTDTFAKGSIAKILWVQADTCGIEYVEPHNIYGRNPGHKTTWARAYFRVLTRREPDWSV